MAQLGLVVGGVGAASSSSLPDTGLPGEDNLPSSPRGPSLYYLEAWASCPTSHFSLLAAYKHPSPIFLALLPEGDCSGLLEGWGGKLPLGLGEKGCWNWPYPQDKTATGDL